MSVLFHFIFNLAKIAVLATVYAALILLIVRLVSRMRPYGWIDTSTRNQIKFWKSTFYIIAVGLFIYCFTYWGDHGLGDTSLLPVGHGQTIAMEMVLLRISTRLTIDSDTFITTVLAVDNYVRNKTAVSILIYHFETRELTEFNNKTEYENYAKSNKLPTADKFKDFISHYRDYWNGWRMILLP